MAKRFLEVKERLWRDIQRGRFGDRLPPEPELAAVYAVSRMTLRRSIAELTDEGFLEPRPGRGTYVLQEPPARSGGPYTIGLVTAWQVSEASSDPYFGGLFIALATALGSRGCLITFANDREQLAPTAPVVGERVSRRPVDGIVAMAYDRDHVWDLLSLRVPLVLADCPPLPERSCVLPDNRDGIFQAVRHLVDLGHRRIAHLHGHLNSIDGQERLTAFREALAQHGLDSGADLIADGHFDVDEGAAALHRLFDSSDAPPTAVVCANDRSALGALRALRERGLQAPADCSVIGFDDIDAATHCTPPLTTVRIDPRDLAARVADTLLEDLGREPEDRAGRTLRVPGTLVVRGSTAAPRPSA